MEAAYPDPWRPAHYRLAAGITAAVLVSLVLSSVVTFAGGLPARATLFGLPAVGLVLVASVFGARALRRPHGASRRRALILAGGLLGLALTLWLLVADVFTFTLAAGPGVSAAVVLACLPTTAAGLLIVRRLDRNEQEPWRLVLIAFAWGAVVSTSLVVWGESLWEQVASARLVPGPGLDASTAFSAGIFEELAKGSAVLLIYLLMRDELDDVVDGIVYGAAVGLGFNFLESISYMTHLYALYAPDGQGASAAAAQWYMRQVLGLFFGHATYTALIGAGVGVARQLARQRDRVIAIGAGFLAAIAAHFAWDAWAQLFPVSQTPFALVEIHLRTLFMAGPFTAAILLLIAMGLQLEGRALRRQLAAEAQAGTGTVTAEEAMVLLSPWRRLRARLGALLRGGPGAYVRVARLQRAQLELAMERWHRERQELDRPQAAEDALRRRVLALRPAAVPTGGVPR